ncbi:MAG: glycosyltransferase [Lachnospiraceae bacterium]|nr:glycosyltransferase [Lachnospiraceae bacterium]
MLEMKTKNIISGTQNRAHINELINFEDNNISIKVSIIIPVYNVAHYLRECLNSAINQTLKEIEIICVNDGSTDDSLSILKEYARSDKRVKIIDKENSGYGHTMNLGMDMAAGKYIGIIESDDFVDERMYERLYELAEYNDVDWVKADFNRFIIKDGHCVKRLERVGKSDKYYNRIISPQEETYAYRFQMNTWSGIYRCDFLRNNNIRHNETPGASFQDNGFWFQTMIYAHRVYISDYQCYMNRRDNPNSSVYNRGKMTAIFDEYKYIEKILKSNNLWDEYSNLFNLKKLHNYLFHYNRISDEDKTEFIEMASKEFSESIRTGEVTFSDFKRNEEEKYKWIATTPKDFCKFNDPNAIVLTVVVAIYKKISDDNLLLSQLSVIDNRESIEVILLNFCNDRIESGYFPYLNTQVFDCVSEPLYISLNNAINNANGKYVLFLREGDFALHKNFDFLISELKDKSPDICIFKAKKYTGNSENRRLYKEGFVEKNMPGTGLFSPADMRGRIFCTFSNILQNKVIRKHLLLFNELTFDKRDEVGFGLCNKALICSEKILPIKREIICFEEINDEGSIDYIYSLKEIKKIIDNVDGLNIFFKSWCNLAVHICSIKYLDEYDMPNFIDSYFAVKRFIDESQLESVDPRWIWADYTSDYVKCRRVARNSLEAELSAIINDKNSENNRLKKLIEKKESEISVVKRHVEADRHNEIISLNNDIARLQYELLATRTSLSCRIGLAITWLPRSIRQIYRNISINREPIHIVYVTDDNYVMPTSVSITSIKQNKHIENKCIVHVISNHLSKKSIDKLKSLEDEQFKIDIIYAHIDEQFINVQKKDGDRHVTSTATLKFQIPQLLAEIEKVIYIDGDTLILKDLSPLYSIDLKNNYVAAVKDIISIRGNHLKSIDFKGKDYFNSGMLLMNLREMRKDRVVDKLIEYRMHGKNHFVDQDALNQVFIYRTLFISPMYNFLNKFYDWMSPRDLTEFYEENMPQSLNEAIQKATIIHFGSHEKPWLYNLPECTELFLKYYSVSPFSEERLSIKDSKKIVR